MPASEKPNNREEADHRKSHEQIIPVLVDEVVERQLDLRDILNRVLHFFGEGVSSVQCILIDEHGAVKFPEAG